MNKQAEINALFSRYASILDSAVESFDKGVTEYRRIVGPINAEAAASLCKHGTLDTVIDSFAEDAVEVQTLLHEARRRFLSARALALKLTE